MASFVIEGLKCGGCVANITRLINEECPDVTVDVDLDSKQVRVPDSCSEAVVKAAAEKGGYTYVGPVS